MDAVITIGVIVLAFVRMAFKAQKKLSQNHTGEKLVGKLGKLSTPGAGMPTGMEDWAKILGRTFGEPAAGETLVEEAPSGTLEVVAPETGEGESVFAQAGSVAERDAHMRWDSLDTAIEIEGYTALEGTIGFSEGIDDCHDVLYDMLPSSGEEGSDDCHPNAIVDPHDEDEAVPVLPGLRLRLDASSLAQGVVLAEILARPQRGGRRV